ncbi:MAG: hypothetical protein RI988_4143 [Pseudomonadota bacterium]
MFVLVSGDEQHDLDLANREQDHAATMTKADDQLAKRPVCLGVQTFVAVLKARNFRSEALLRSLGFEPAGAEQQAEHRDEADELVVMRSAS